MKRVRISVAVPKADDPTSFYRAFGPLAALRSKFAIDYLLPAQHGWPTLGLSDLLFLQRPAHPQTLVLANTAKICRTPLWVDFDDDNLAVPEGNESHPQFSQWEVKDSIVKIARLADVVTVSTEFLRKKYSIFNPRGTILVPNALDEKYFHLRNIIPKRPRDKVILWRGSLGSQENMEEIEEALVEVANKNPSWKFIFFGMPPWRITKRIKNKQLIGWMENFLDYLQTICQLHATTFIHCLSPNDHSYSRSNVSWLEATFSGSAMLAKDMPEFQRPGCLNFKDASEFKEKLQAIMNRDIDVQKAYETSWEYIQENLVLSKTNELRAQIIDKLTSESE